MEVARLGFSLLSLLVCLSVRLPAERYAEHTPNWLAVGGDRDAWCMRRPPPLLVCVCGEEGLEGRVLFMIVIVDFFYVDLASLWEYILGFLKLCFFDFVLVCDAVIASLGRAADVARGLLPRQQRGAASRCLHGAGAGARALTRPGQALSLTRPASAKAKHAVG